LPARPAVDRCAAAEGPCRPQEVVVALPFQPRAAWSARPDAAVVSSALGFRREALRSAVRRSAVRRSEVQRSKAQAPSAKVVFPGVVCRRAAFPSAARPSARLAAASAPRVLWVLPSWVLQAPWLRPEVPAVACALAVQRPAERLARAERPKAVVARAEAPPPAASDVAAEPRQAEEAARSDAAAGPQRVAAVAVSGAAAELQREGAAAVQDAAAGLQQAAAVAASDVAAEPQQAGAAPDAPVLPRAAARPSAAPSVFRRGLTLPWPARRRAARSAHAMRRLRAASPSERSWQAARCEALS
jgi:hypothetical protein